MSEIKVIRETKDISKINISDTTVFGMDVEKFLDALPEEPLFDLVVTSPPYNIGKEYENKVDLCIDHHISNSRYASKNYVENTGACCEILYEFIKLLNVTINADIATSLMTGIVTDTGNFSHSNVTNNTMKIAYELFSIGASLHVITKNVFNTQSKERAKLYAKVISNMRYLLNGKMTVLVITLNDIKEANGDVSMTEGFIDFALSIDTCEVAVSILQINDKSYKISFRSKGKVNVNEVASLYGGGGHILASGAMMNGYLEDIIDKLAYNVKQRL